MGSGLLIISILEAITRFIRLRLNGLLRLLSANHQPSWVHTHHLVPHILLVPHLQVFRAVYHPLVFRAVYHLLVSLEDHPLVSLVVHHPLVSLVASLLVTHSLRAFLLLEWCPHHRRMCTSSKRSKLRIRRKSRKNRLMQLMKIPNALQRNNRKKPRE